MLLEVFLVNYRLGICDTDSHYSMGLMEYINMHANIPLKCIAFSSIECMAESVSKSELDIALIDEAMEVNALDGIFDGIPFIRLTTHKVRSDGANDIYKYQNVEYIVEALLGRLESLHRNIRVEQRIYGVYSPIGRCGKTRLAMGICSYHGKSLYIGMEDYPSVYVGDKPDMEACRERFMYYWISKNIKIMDCIMDMSEKKDSFSCIYGAVYFADNRQILSEHISWLSDILRREGTYNRVVFDIGTGSLSDISLLDSFDSVFIPVLNDMVSERKLKVFRDLLSRGICSMSEDRVVEVVVPDGEYDSTEIMEYVKGENI